MLFHAGHVVNVNMALLLIFFDMNCVQCLKDNGAWKFTMAAFLPNNNILKHYCTTSSGNERKSRCLITLEQFLYYSASFNKWTLGIHAALWLLYREVAILFTKSVYTGIILSACTNLFGSSFFRSVLYHCGVFCLLIWFFSLSPFYMAYHCQFTCLW